MTFWRDLELFGERIALITAEGVETSYADLARAADAWALSLRARLPARVTRPVVLIETTNTIPPITAYLGALRAGWPVILSADGATAADPRVRDIYAPNVLVRSAGGAWPAEIANDQPIAAHAELALLLSTSGTTGAPKLVRLSAGNLSANARAIAEYLEIGAAERAITTLPFHYSYGMSVLHSHLLMGASLILTDRSLIEDEFWACCTRHGATSMALVPVQFDLLDKTGFEARDLPALTTITQAGGKLAEPVIQRFAAIARQRGFRLFVMYGQTEAAPRMAYVPPADLAANADAIGRAIPGGRFELVGEDGRLVGEADRVGELVYHGPNVMMGYAMSPADFALPPGPPVLHTGDLALRKPNGYYRITGRLSRFVKMYGLRLGLDEIEQRLRAQGVAAYVTGTDQKITVFATVGGGQCARLEAELAQAYALPPSALDVTVLDAVPLLATGKVDYRALAARAAALKDDGSGQASSLAEAFAAALGGKAVDPSKSFVEHGGDSLAYLEVQMALTDRLGVAPQGWETMPLAALEALQAPTRPALTTIGLDLICRNLALIAVIGLHAIAWPIAGGVHVLLMLTGYSIARFQKPKLLAGNIASTLATMLGAIAACYFLILTGVNFALSPVDPEWFVFLGNYDADIHPHGITPYWFVCLYVQAVLLIALPFLVPRVRQWVGARPFAAGLVSAIGLAVAALFLQWPSALGPTGVRNPIMALQLIAVGWCLFHAQSRSEKAVATLIAGTVALAFWPAGSAVPVLITASAVAIVWLVRLPVPTLLARAAMYFGKQSMFIYLAHVIVISVVAKLALPSDALVLIATIALSLVAAEALSRGLRGVMQLSATGRRRAAS